MTQLAHTLRAFVAASSRPRCCSTARVACATARESRQHARAVARADHQEDLARRREHRHEGHGQDKAAIRCSMIRSSAASSAKKVQHGPRERQFQSAGSGVIVDAKNGYIITNAHVIENADRNHGDAAGRSRGEGRNRRQGHRLRCRGVESRGEEPRGHAARRFREGRSRRLRDRDRQSVRPAAHRHLRHHQRARPLGHQSRRLRRFHSDRRVDQSRQFRRRARRISTASSSA